MRSTHSANLIPIALALAALISLALWLGGRTPAPQPEREPGKDGLVNTRVSRPAVNLAGTFTRFDGVATDLPGLWTQFRGPDGDAISKETLPLATTWPKDGPAQLWTLDLLGEGHAGVAVRKGRVYLMDYDQEAQQDALRCLSLADGREIWRRAYPVRIKRNHGMSRTIPAVTDRYIVTLGPKCHVLCVDADTGAYKWGLDLVRDYGTKVPAWYAGQCPIIDNGKAILAPGGSALMIAVDCATGKVLWKTPNPHNWQMTHTSILPYDFAGQRMYLYVASGGVVGVSATDGKILWETPEWQVDIAAVPTPVPVGDGRIFLCGGYNAGSMMIQLVQEAGKITVKERFRLPATQFGSDQQTPIFYDGYLYGVIPGGQLVCLDLQGKTRWASGPQHRFGLGPYTMTADGLLYVMNDQGRLTLVQANPEKYQQLAEAHVLDGHDTWAPMALAGGRLIARDLKRMVCLDVAAQ